MKSIKHPSLLGLALVVVLVTLASFLLLAQPTASALKSGKLSEARDLMLNGKPQQARELIATIAPTDPEHGVARFYDAVALHETQDKLGFLKAMETLKTNTTVIPAELKHNLAVRQMDALFHYRKFDDLLTNASSFEQAHPESEQLQIMEEYRLAALFERGMKKTIEACNTKDEAQFNKRWAEGKANLEQFLALASSFHGTNYTSIKKHTLSEDIRVARLTLGDEKAVREEVPIQDVVEREKVELLRVRLYRKLQPEKVERNLEMMQGFIKEFPESESRKRIEFDMANISFPLGKQAILEAEVLELAGDSRSAASRRAVAQKHFELQRALQNERAGKAEGVDAPDVIDLRGDLLYGYFLEKDYTQLSVLTSALLAEAAPGDTTWVMAKVYNAIALQSQTPPRTQEAKTIFDEVLSLNFTNKPERDYYLILGARWRANIAVATGDHAKTTELAHWVQAGQCAKELKNSFLREYGTAVSTETNNSK